MSPPPLHPERRIEVDSVLRCRKCQETHYKVFRRQNVQQDGTLLQSFGHVLWPAHGQLDPPLHPEWITCPTCGESLSRGAP